MEAEDADIGKVHSALHELLNDLSNSNSGFLILKPSDEVPVEELQAVADKQIVGVIRDRFLELHAEEATPILLPSHADRVSVRFDTLGAAVDAWKGCHDSEALARREAEKMDIAAPGRGHSTDVERLQRRLVQQESSMISFSEKIDKQQALGHMIQENWTHVESLLSQVDEAVEVQGWKATKKAIKEIAWIVSVNAAERTFVTTLPDEDGHPNGPQATLSLDETVHQNSQRHFASARKQKNKNKGAVDALKETVTRLKTAQKKETKAEATGKLNRIKRSKRFWFETHRWSMISGGHLLVGGKDAKGNDSVVKRHLSVNDLYLHADIHGAPSCSLRSAQGFIVDQQKPAHIPDDIPAFRVADKLEDSALDDDKLLEAATMALCWSRAWAGGGAHGTVYSVKPAQVSKTANTGEFVGKGAFIVRGQRTWFKDLDVRLGIGIVAINGVPLLMGATPATIKNICKRYAILSPGLTKKEQLANQIYKNTGLMTDDILGILPGSGQIIEDHGIFSPPKQIEQEEE